MKKDEGKKPSLLRRLLIFVVVMLLILVLAYILLFRVNRFDLKINIRGDESIVLNTHDTFTDSGAEVKLCGTLFFREGIAVEAEILASEDIQAGVPGTYPVTYETQWYNLSAKAVRNILIRDMDPPVITLNTIPGQFTIPGETYIEEGFSAWDEIDGDLTDRVIRQEADGVVTYTVTDAAGNETTSVREIYYFTPEVPILTLLGGSTIHIPAGTPYEEAGWSVRGAVSDTDYSVQVTGSVDHYLAGTYELLYTLTDIYGNVVEATREVVVDAQPLPEIVIPEGNVIYLTFDDGPSSYTERLLDVLAKYDVKATFFVVNTEYVDLVKRIVDEGHSIAIHSMYHNYRQIYASPEAYFHDILSMQQIIYELTGVKTYLMRFPGGSSNTVSGFNKGIMTYLTQAVEDNGFRYFDWNVTSGDAGEVDTSNAVFSNVKGGVTYHKGGYSIVLQHDTAGFSVSAVERIIQWALENGYRFLPLDMTSPTAHHTVNN